MYKATANSDAVIRIRDGAFIPADPTNRDYQDYLKAVASGVRTAPADPIVEAPVKEDPLAALEARIEALEERVLSSEVKR